VDTTWPGKRSGICRDLESRVTTSVEITQAYLERIRVYDQGQFGFHAFEVVAQDALEQARPRITRAFMPRAAAGDPHRGKKLYDSFDMPTRTQHDVRGIRPAHDAFQVGSCGVQAR